MTKMWDLDSASIDDLLLQIKKSQLALPQFQRKWVWKKANWIPFLATILRGRPAGTLLLLEVDGTSQGFAPVEIVGAPPIGGTSDLQWLLLDGQQRLTTTYHAFCVGFGNGNSTKRFILQVTQMLDRGEVDETDLDLVKASDVKSPSDMAKRGQLELSTLLDAADFTSWQIAFEQKFKMTIKEQNDRLAVAAPGILSAKNYVFPVLRVRKETPLDVVVDIFERMNGSGQPLSQFDLMVARLYQEVSAGVYYNLREAWERALDNSPQLLSIGVKPDQGMLPLQLIAMQVSRLSDNVRPAGVKGLKSSDVLALPASQVIGKGAKVGPPLIAALNLEVAVQALDDAAKFLKTKCGVISNSLMPQISMLLPLADQFLQPKKSRLSDEVLMQWFFAAGLSLRYYGGVNSAAEADCKALMDQAQGKVASTPVVTAVTKAVVEDLNLKQPMNREGHVLGSTIMALLISSGARDWKGKGPLLTHSDEIDIHHMVPEQRLTAMGLSRDRRRPIALLTPLDSKTNRELGQLNPADVLKALGGGGGTIMASHHVHEGNLAKAYGSISALDKFIAAREAALKKFIVAELNL